MWLEPHGYVAKWIKNEDSDMLNYRKKCSNPVRDSLLSIKHWLFSMVVDCFE